MKKQQAILSLGSNLGNRLELLQQALTLLERHSIQIKSLSSLYETPAWGFESSPFYNACALIETELSPKEVLAVFLKIEKQMGRFRTETKGYRARQIDLDLIFYSDLILDSSYLTLPHPRLHLRNFVLVPLNEIAPLWIHPKLGKTSTELLNQSPDQDQIKKLKYSLWSPPVFDAFSYIAIEGNIGIGKSTLAQKMASVYQVPYLQETFTNNPYLEKFYTDPKTYALPLEQFFLEDRFRQAEVFWKQNKGKVIADYSLEKSLIFAQLNLNEKDFYAFQTRFKTCYQQLRKPDLVVYLHTDLPQLQQQIKKRGRHFEQQIQKEYLEQIEMGYQNYFQLDLPYPVLRIGTSHLDFEHNESDFQSLLRLIYQASFS
jgi:deoxyguanosine kinase